jgi:hypothetical protein
VKVFIYSTVLLKLEDAECLNKLEKKRVPLRLKPSILVDYKRERRICEAIKLRLE